VQSNNVEPILTFFEILYSFLVCKFIYLNNKENTIKNQCVHIKNKREHYKKVIKKNIVLCHKVDN